MKRIALTIVLCITPCLSAQVSVTGSWQPQTLHPELPAFGRRNVNLNVLAAGVEVGVLRDRLTVFGATGTGNVYMHGLGINGTLDCYWQGGLSLTAWRSGPWTVGLSADVQQWRATESFLLAGHPLISRLDLIEYRVRPRLAYEVDSVTLYGGPVLAWLDGSWEMSWGHLISQPVQTRLEVGAFAGAAWRIHPRVSLLAEVETGRMGQAARLGLGYQF